MTDVHGSIFNNNLGLKRFNSVVFPLEILTSNISIIYCEDWSRDVIICCFTREGKIKVFSGGRDLQAVEGAPLPHRAVGVHHLAVLEPDDAGRRVT